MDREGKPVTQFKERIENLVGELSVTSDVIGIPTPALAETLVRSGPNRAAYMKVLGDSYKFQIVPFDSRAAIESADLVALVKDKKDKWDIWAKVKFDIQIVAIAKAEGASLIYSDDHHIENFAKKFSIPVARICDLPVPTPPKPVLEELTGQSGFVFGEAPAEVTKKEETPDEAAQPVAPKEGKGTPTDTTELRADDTGRAGDEATAKAKEKGHAKPEGWSEQPAEGIQLPEGQSE